MTRAHISWQCFHMITPVLCPEKSPRPNKLHLSYLPAPFQPKGSLKPCAPVEEAGDEGMPQLRDFICADAWPLRLK